MYDNTTVFYVSDMVTTLPQILAIVEIKKKEMEPDQSTLFFFNGERKRTRRNRRTARQIEKS